MWNLNFLCVCASVFQLYWADAAENVNIFPNLPIRVPKTKNDLCNEQSDMMVGSLENYTLWAFESMKIVCPILPHIIFYIKCLLYLKK